MKHLICNPKHTLSATSWIIDQPDGVWEEAASLTLKPHLDLHQLQFCTDL